MTLELADNFAKALDANDFDAALHFLTDDCVYEIGTQYIVGHDKIIASYKGNADWASSAIDEVILESQVEAEGTLFLVTYTDKITHKGLNHIYRCQQLLSFNDRGLINRILHREIQGEKENLQAFETRAGIIRPNTKDVNKKKPLIQLEEHNPEWENSFLKLKSAFEDLFGNIIRCLDHFGSTSIRGIAAKPVIDMIGLVTSLPDVDNKVAQGLPATISCLGENGVLGRRYFVIDLPRENRGHLHLFADGNREYKDRILFRDFLRENPAKAKEYEQLKLKLSVEYADDPVAYWTGKKLFVNEVIQQALLDKLSI